MFLTFTLKICLLTRLSNVANLKDEYLYDTDIKTTRLLHLSQVKNCIQNEDYLKPIYRLHVISVSLSTRYKLRKDNIQRERDRDRERERERETERERERVCVL